MFKHTQSINFVEINLLNLKRNNSLHQYHSLKVDSLKNEYFKSKTKIEVRRVSKGY